MKPNYCAIHLIDTQFGLVVQICWLNVVMWSLKLELQLTETLNILTPYD